MSDAKSPCPLSACSARLCGESSAAEPGPWATYRGNPQRTGNTDNQAGPEKPVVLWVVKSQDHFVASPVPVKDGMYLAGIGAFNRPTISVFPLAAKNSAAADVDQVRPVPQARVGQFARRRGRLPRLRRRHAPGFRRRTALPSRGDRQAALATHAARATSSTWKARRSSRAARSSSAAARPACSASNSRRRRSTARSTTLPTIAKMQDARWKELVAKYEEAKAKKDDFAIPPDDSQLLKFAPKNGVAEGRGEVARRCAGEPRRRHAARADLVPRQGEGRRAGALRLNAATGETVWKTRADVQPLGRGHRRRRSRHRAGQFHRLLPQGTQGREGRRHRARPQDR